jgi:hypothetical protein
MSTGKSKNFSKKVKESENWKEAEMIYSDLYAELSMPPMLRLGGPLSLREINTMLNGMIEACDAFYPAYMERGERKYP